MMRNNRLCRCFTVGAARGWAGVLLALALLVAPAAAAPPGPNPAYRQNGYWDPPLNVRMIPIHMVLLRGTGAAHSQVLWFGDGNDVRLWPVDPLADLSAVEALLPRPTANSDIFCAGHSVLPDGRVLVTGGTEIARGDFHGLSHLNLFDPVTSSWQTPRPPDMNYPRWYPTNTALPDGRVLLTSGLMYKEMEAFGGRSGGISRDDQLSFGLRATPISVPAPITGAPPPGRSEHTMIYDDSAQEPSVNNFRERHRFVIYGGETSAGAPLGDVWAGTRDEFDTRAWTQLAPTPDPVYGTPSARSRHAAVYVPRDSTMYVVCGRGPGGSALADVWALWLPGGTTSAPRWKRLTPSGVRPSLARWGHTAVLDTMNAGAPRIFLFGGTDGALFRNDLWSLTLGASPRWDSLTVHSARPSPRAEHVAIFDPRHDRHRLVIFGGGRPDSLFNDVWSLDAHADTALVWREIFTTDAYNIFAPVPRVGAAAVYDAQWDRMNVIGGDSNGDAAGGELDDFWTLGLNFKIEPGEREQRRHMRDRLHQYARDPAAAPGGEAATPSGVRRDRLSPSHDHGRALPRLYSRWDLAPVSLAGGPRTGMALAYDPRWLYAHYPEIYDPLTGGWTVLTSASLWQVAYPDMFVLPSGRLLYSGPSYRTYLLDLTSPARWITPTWSLSQIVGGTAVMYRPGKVMKCGAEAFAGTNQGVAIDLSGEETTAQWQFIAPMNAARVKHNLTLLPDGTVLASGGVVVETNPATATRSPEIWNPATNSWSSLLAPEASVRDYHSAAILLPDGRLLSGGGDRSVVDRWNVEIFWPPYLFRPDGTLAPRPTIAAVDTVLDYGEAFDIATPEAAAIASVALIRPSAVTHQFNQEQRYVPLGFTTGPGNVLHAVAPPNANVAPPGDYLLFLVDSQGVPAVGRWVHLPVPTSASATRVPPDSESREGDGHPALTITPNPVPAGATVRLALRSVGTGPVQLKVFDAQGRRVRELPGADRTGTDHQQLSWDCCDDDGLPLPNGVYFIRAQSREGSRTVRMVLAR